jgi:hypothetical protein
MDDAQKTAIRQLHLVVINMKTTDLEREQTTLLEKADQVLWQTVIAFQNTEFQTASGLPFSYQVKCKKNGEYSGELVVSRKEDSKTLTRSSVMLAFHKVLESIRIKQVADADGNDTAELILQEYKGPKAIGQIFGISYVYSLFWNWGLILVPEKVEQKLKV